MEAERDIDADRVVEVLDRIVSDQGLGVRSPCVVTTGRRGYLSRPVGLVSSSQPDPRRVHRNWQPRRRNPFRGSCSNSRVRDELLAVEVFPGPAEVKVMVEDFRQDYNRCPGRIERTRLRPPLRSEDGLGATAHQAARASAELHSPYGLPPFKACANPNLAGTEPTTRYHSRWHP